MWACMAAALAFVPALRPSVHAETFSCRTRAPLCSELARDELMVVLKELESIRDLVSTDIAAAAMQAAREKRSLDSFISELQDEVTGLGAEIDEALEFTELHLQEQAEAMARDKRSALTSRAEALLEELEASAPASFKQRESGLLDAEEVGRYKSPFLPVGARVVVAGTSSPFGALLSEDLAAKGLEIVRGPDSCPPGCADPTLPASSSLRRELDGADACVFVCSGAAEGGVSSTFISAAARVLPKTLRRVVLLAPRGVDRTFDFAFAMKNVLGGLDRQRASEQAMAAACERVGAALTVMRAEVSPGKGATMSASGFRLAATDFLISPGDSLSGQVEPSVASEAMLQLLRREESFGVRFSLGSRGGSLGGLGSRGGMQGAWQGGKAPPQRPQRAMRNGLAELGAEWDDEFLKLAGPEVSRLRTSTPVPPDWLRGWARRLEPGGAGSAGVLSSFQVYDLPTASAAAAAKQIATPLPSGVRIHFLASGVEFVGEDEEERVKGDFDGALDLLAEQDRVRIVRAEMLPVWRRGTDGGRKKVAPLVKVTSEAHIVKRLADDLRREDFSC